MNFVAVKLLTDSKPQARIDTSHIPANGNIVIFIVTYVNSLWALYTLFT